MAAHGRKDEWRELPGFPEIDHGADNDVNVADTPASHPDRNGGPRRETGAKASRAQFAENFTRNVGQPPVRKVLANQNHARQCHSDGLYQLMRFLTGLLRLPLL